MLFLFFFYVSAANDLIPHVWDVPTENPNFVGREDILAEISNLFKSASLKTAVITGPQGFGKSQTAKHFVYQSFSNYDVVWWFRSNQYLKPQFERFALAIAPYLGMNIEKSIFTIGHEYLISMIKEGIRRKKLRCLFVFDDARIYSDIEPYVFFSHNKTIHTLITTKNGNFSNNALQMKPFRRKDSLKYINLFLPNNLDSAKSQLARHLGDCPAALAMAIDYIKSYPGMTIEHYLSKHASQKMSLPSHSMSSKKLGSSIDGYEQDLLAAIQINMKEIRQRSEVAYQFLGLISVLHRDEIPLHLIEKWLVEKGIKTNIITLVDLIKQYSLIEITDSNTTKEAYITMQDLIQEIVNSLIPIADKKKLIKEVVELLKDSFSDRADKNVEAILKDNKPLLNVIKLSEEAHAISYHSSDLTFLRIRALDILAGIIRDFPTIEQIFQHLDSDFKAKVSLLKEDEVLYNAIMALYSGIRSPDYDKAIFYGIKALKLAESTNNMYEEQMRIIANLIQHHSFTGRIEESAKFIEMGEKLLSLSQSDSYNALFIIAKNSFLLDRGELKQTIDLIAENENLFKRQDLYPSMRYYVLSQLAEALIKEDKIERASNALERSEKWSRNFHGEKDDNFFFGRLYVLKATLLMLSSPNSFEEAKSMFERGLGVYQACFHAPDKHRGQAFAHLQLGKLYHHHKHYDKAKANYIKSEAIFDKLLKGKKINDVSELYKCLSILGVDTNDETLTHTYLKNQLAIFGLDHPKTKETLLYLDAKGVRIPI